MTYAVVALGALGLSFVLSWALARAAPRLGLLDAPTPGKIHTRAVPTMGGLPLVLVFLAALWVTRSLGWEQLTGGQMWGVTLGTLVVAALGVADDLRGLGAWGKLGVEALAGGVVYLAGLEVTQLTNPFGETILLDRLAGPLTVLWLLVLTNAINLIDGLDGLAAGVVGIGALTLFLIALRFDERAVLVPALLLAAVTAGFLPLNWPPARLFLGDTGSLSLGFLMGVVSLIENRKSTVAVTLLLPIVLMSVPLLDAALAVVRRVRNGQHPFRRDTQHLHHRLLGLGLAPRQIVTLLYGVSVYLGLTAFLISVLPKQQVLLVLLILGLAMALAVVGLRYLEGVGRLSRGPGAGA